jgi:hypothetical protein
MKKPGILAAFAPFLMLICDLKAQMITGTWHGKINRQKVEVKIIQSGDSLYGTSYYYESVNNFRRYSVRGYFDQQTNSAVWWDDQLIEERSARFSLGTPGKVPLLSRADFNCPGSGKMMLNGKSMLVDSDVPNGDVHLDKIPGSTFDDEWNYVIDNYTVGTNDPDIIDSVGLIAFQPVKKEDEPVVSIEPVKPVSKPAPPVIRTITPDTKQKMSEPVVKETVPVIVPIEEKFRKREKIFTKEIPVTGDSLELRFYDNAEVDGDSISLFLNDKLIFQHIRLTASAYTIKLAVSELLPVNELIMVAENMGSIPPNTSYMVAINGKEQYDAYLASTEGSSAMIRLTRK